MRNAGSQWRACARRCGCRLALAWLILGALSCGGIPKTNYYTLRLPAPPLAGDPKTTFVLGVEHFRALDVLRDDRIVYYESPTRLNFYQYHRWSSDPATLLSELTARLLTEMRIFTDVRLMPSREPVDYLLKGRVFSFEEVDEGSGTKARVGMEMTLVRARDHKVVWSEERQAERPIEAKGVAGVVDALNASTEAILREVLPGLAAQVERDFSQLGQSQ